MELGGGQMARSYRSAKKSVSVYYPGLQFHHILTFFHSYLLFFFSFFFFEIISLVSDPMNVKLDLTPNYEMTIVQKGLH